MKNRGFGHLKTRLLTINTSKNVDFGGPWLLNTGWPRRFKMDANSPKIDARDTCEKPAHHFCEGWWGPMWSGLRAENATSTSCGYHPTCLKDSVSSQIYVFWCIKDIFDLLWSHSWSNKWKLEWLPSLGNDHISFSQPALLSRWISELPVKGGTCLPRCAECMDYLPTWKLKNGHIQGEMAW